MKRNWEALHSPKVFHGVNGCPSTHNVLPWGWKGFPTNWKLISLIQAFTKPISWTFHHGWKLWPIHSPVSVCLPTSAAIYPLFFMHYNNNHNYFGNDDQGIKNGSSKVIITTFIINRDYFPIPTLKFKWEVFHSPKVFHGVNGCPSTHNVLPWGWKGFPTNWKLISLIQAFTKPISWTFHHGWKLWPIHSPVSVCLPTSAAIYPLFFMHYNNNHNYFGNDDQGIKNGSSKVIITTFIINRYYSLIPTLKFK